MRLTGRPASTSSARDQPEPLRSGEHLLGELERRCVLSQHDSPPAPTFPLILVGNDFFYDRDQIYATRAGFDDFLLRYVFFCRALIRACERFDITPDILHCHDWHTAMLPVYLHSGLRGSPQFRNTRSVFTIHNLNYQGAAAPDAFNLTGLHSRYWSPDALEHFGTLNPMKGGIIFADEVTTVSPNYAREHPTSQYGAGLDACCASCPTN